MMKSIVWLLLLVAAFAQDQTPPESKESTPPDSKESTPPDSKESTPPDSKEALDGTPEPKEAPDSKESSNPESKSSSPDSKESSAPDSKESLDGPHAVHPPHGWEAQGARPECDDLLNSAMGGTIDNPTFNIDGLSSWLTGQETTDMPTTTGEPCGQSSGSSMCNGVDFMGIHTVATEACMAEGSDGDITSSQIKCVDGEGWIYEYDNEDCSGDATETLASEMDIDVTCDAFAGDCDYLIVRHGDLDDADSCHYETTFYDVAIVMNDCYNIGGMGEYYVAVTCEGGELTVSQYDEDGCSGTPVNVTINDFPSVISPDGKGSEDAPDSKESSGPESKSSSPDGKESDAPDSKEALDGTPEPKEAPDSKEALDGTPEPKEAPDSKEALDGTPEPKEAPDSKEAMDGTPEPKEAPDSKEALDGTPEPKEAPDSKEAMDGTPEPKEAPDSKEAPEDSKEGAIWDEFEMMFSTEDAPDSKSPPDSKESNPESKSSSPESKSSSPDSKESSAPDSKESSGPDSKESSAPDSKESSAPDSKESSNPDSKSSSNPESKSSSPESKSSSSSDDAPDSKEAPAHAQCMQIQYCSTDDNSGWSTQSDNDESNTGGVSAHAVMTSMWMVVAAYFMM